MDHIVSSSHIRHRLQTDFSKAGDISRLTRLIGVTPTQARRMIRGEENASLLKPAALYGFEPAYLPNEWRKADRQLDPKTVGWHRWSDAEIQDLCDRVKRARNLGVVARSLGIREGKLRAALHRHGIKISDLRAAS